MSVDAAKVYDVEVFKSWNKTITESLQLSQRTLSASHHLYNEVFDRQERSKKRIDNYLNEIKQGKVDCNRSKRLIAERITKQATAVFEDLVKNQDGAKWEQFP